MNGMLRPPIDVDENQPWGIDKMRQRLSKLGGGTGMLAGGDNLQGDKSRYAQYAAGATRNFNPQSTGAGLNQIGHNIANGMLANRELGRMNRTAGQEEAAWGMLGDPSAMLKSAPVGGEAHQYALKQREAATAHEAQQNDLAYQARLKNTQLRNDRLSQSLSGPTELEQARTEHLRRQTDLLGRTEQDKVRHREEIKQEFATRKAQEAKGQATTNIGNMIDRLGQVTNFDDKNVEKKSPYTPHEVGSSIGNWQGGEAGALNWLNIAGKVGGWLETLRSDHAPRDIRARIKGDALALSAAVKKVARGAGEGTFTDADQKVLEQQIGDLTKASSVENYKQRLDDLKQRINAAYGLNIGKKKPPPDADEIAIGTTAIGPNGKIIRWDGNDWMPVT